ncbi:hypothetical protein D3C72_1749880 [compost metagenome]
MSIADGRVVTERQAADHLVHVCQARGLDDLVGVAIFHPGDVFPDRALQQRHRLREIADRFPEGPALPEIGVVAIEKDAARSRLQDADQQSGKRRLAGGRRADHAQHFAGGKREGDALDDRHLDARDGVDEFIHNHVAGRMGRRCRLADRQVFADRRFEPAPAGDGEHPLAPVFDDRVEGDEQAADEDA